VIHFKIKNRRQDSLHKYSRKLVDNNAAIFVGNVSSLGLVKTKMAKSVLDAGWGSLKKMLEYKCDYAGVFLELSTKLTLPKLVGAAGVFPIAVRKVEQVCE
jgi:IS605 OrfB family transposase